MTDTNDSREKRYRVTVTFSYYGTSPEDAKQRAEEDTDFLWDRLGEAGAISGRPQVVGVDPEPLPKEKAV